MKKVLIITYYWPPSGGSGVQRWLKFAKYLPEYGWEPIVVTPENPDFEVKDHSLEKDISPGLKVIKLPIWEPYKIMQRFKKRGNQQSDILKGGKKGIVNKAMLWLRGNLFIPDPRVFWVRPTVRELIRVIASENINTVITTGPPHSLHLIGQKLKQKTGVKWIADFRDTWTTWTLYDSFYLSSPVRKLHSKMERSVLNQADKVIAASGYYAQELGRLGNVEVSVITNGFDHEELNGNNLYKPEEFIIRHVGVIDELRNPIPLLEAARALYVEDQMPIKVEFVGNINQALKSYIEDDQVVASFTSIQPYVSHDRVFELYRTAAVLLIVTFRNMPGNIPGKLFEYMTSGRPILAVGPQEGDAAKLIKENKLGLICEPEDKDGIKNAIRILFQQFESLEPSHNTEDIGRFSRKSLTGNLAKILNQL